MSWLSDSTPLVSGGWLSSLYAGHGILGSAIPAGSVFENDFDAGDGAKEFRAVWLTTPSSGTFTPYEDGGFTLSGAADGSYSASYELYVDGVDLGSANVTISIGTTAVGASLSTSYAVLNAVGASLSTSYAVLNDAGTTPVGASLSTTYAVLNAVGASLSTSYGVLRAVGASLSTSYAVEGEAMPSSLIVEDGTGKADAESYASVVAADLYHSQRGNTAWAAYTTAKKDESLRNATEWLDAEFAGMWQGQRATVTQALAWPRVGVCMDGVTIASNALPVALVRATCEMALRAGAASLTKDETAQVKSKTVGPLSITYADGARQQTKYTQVQNLVTPLLGASRNSIRLVRA